MLYRDATESSSLSITCAFENPLPSPLLEQLGKLISQLHSFLLQPQSCHRGAESFHKVCGEYIAHGPLYPSHGRGGAGRGLGKEQACSI